MRRLLIVLPFAGAAPAAAEIDNAKADKLFAEALALRKINPVQACTKFAEALTYNPQAIATLLNVASCDEQQGRIASAAAKYRDLIDRAADQQQDDYRNEAQTRLAAIENEVPHVTLSFAVPPPDGMQVVIDDRVVAITGKQRIEIDPGEREIVVTAPGYIAHVTKILVAKRDDKAVELPALIKASANTRRTIGTISMISGGVLFAGSVGIALVARSRYNDAKARCPADPEGTLVCAAAEDVAALDSAKTLGNVGTVVGIVGIAAAITGGVLWWRSPSAEAKTAARLDVTGDRTQVGVVLHGRF